MARNVVIAEGGMPRRMGGVDRLVTTLAQGGPTVNVTWVPVPLSAQKFISKNGIYYASRDELDAFSKIVVNVPGGVPGTTVPTTNVDGVEVPTGEPPSVMPSIPAGMPSTDPSTGVESLPTEGMVTGIDPDTGVPTTYFTKDGNLTENNVNCGMKVAIPPVKTMYEVGEEIDFTGILCKLTNEDGKFGPRDSRYPDGNIPFSELEFPMTTAAMNRGIATVSGLVIPKMEGVEVEITNTVNYTGVERRYHHTTKQWSTVYYTHEYVADDDVTFVVLVNYSPIGTLGHTVFLACSANPDATVDLLLDGHVTNTYKLNNQWTANSHDEVTKRVYWWKRKHDGCWSPERGTGDCDPWIDENPYKELRDSWLAWAAVYGEVTTKCPVRWRSPYDGRVITDYFDVTVLEKKL